MESHPKMQQDDGFVLRESSSTIDLLWADCDLDAFWHEMPEELGERWQHRLAA